MRGGYDRFSAPLADDKHVAKLLEQVGRHGYSSFQSVRLPADDRAIQPIAGPI